MEIIEALFMAASYGNIYCLAGILEILKFLSHGCQTVPNI